MNRLSIAVVALALAGCTSGEVAEPSSTVEAQRGVLRVLLNEKCMNDLPAVPVQTRYNDWDEVVAACRSEAYYQTNGCKDPMLCIKVMFPDAAQAMAARSGETGTGSTEGNSAVRQDAPAEDTPQ